MDVYQARIARVLGRAQRRSQRRFTAHRMGRTTTDLWVEAMALVLSLAKMLRA